MAQSLFGKDHLIKGVSVHIGSAQPRMKPGHDHGGRGGGYGARAGGYDYGGAPAPWQGSSGGYRGGPRAGDGPSRHYY